MLTKLSVHNFKRFSRVEIDLGNPVIFIGPNNSGKTSALQALALWEIGLRRWNEKRSGLGYFVTYRAKQGFRADQLGPIDPTKRHQWRKASPVGLLKWL